MPREIQIRSREKLPEILSTKAQQPRHEHTATMSKFDRLTMADIYQVSEYCAEIEHHMQKTEHET